MRTLSILSVAAVTAVALAPALSAPAAATSCVGIGDRTPYALVTGTEKRPADEPTYLHTDGFYAVVGTVTDVRVVEDFWSDGGRSEVEVDVGAVFATPPDPQADLSTVTVTQSDPGQMNGYGFEPGTRYFIPLAYKGPDGMSNYSFVCDPISEVDRPQQLIRAARDAGVVEVRVPDSEAPTQQTGTGQSSTGQSSTGQSSTGQQPVVSSGVPPSGGGGGFPLLPVGVGLAALAVAGALLLRRLRPGRYGSAHGAGPA